MKSPLQALLLATSVTACVTGPESEPKSPLNYVNGDHYKVTESLGGVPLRIERTAPATTIEGKAVLDRSELYERPLKYTDVLLVEGEKVVARAVTEESGHFKFLGQIKNGVYHVKAAPDELLGKARVQVDSYEVKGVVLKVKPKS